MDLSRREAVDRRTVLGTAATGLAATTLAGCLGSASGSTEEPAESADFGDWFDGVAAYDGVVDATGRDSVAVEVGASIGGKHHSFAPAAVRVSPGTTVVWTWTGNGGMHNVVAADGSYESELTSAKGETFERTFEEAGVSKYYCAPHRSSGMKGAVVTE